MEKGNEKTKRISSKQRLKERKEELSKLTLGEILNDEELTNLINKASALKDIKEEEIIKIGVSGICNGEVPLRTITFKKYVIDCVPRSDS